MMKDLEQIKRSGQMLIDLLGDKDMSMKYLLQVGDSVWHIETLPNYWSKEANTKENYAITITDEKDEYIEALEELTVEEFEEFINELIKFRDVMKTEINL